MQNKVTVWIFTTNFFCNISHSKKKQAEYYQEYTYFFMYSIHYSCKILMKLEFLNRFSKNTQISNFMKICPVGAKLFHEGRQT